jgi:citrate synthase
MSETVKLTYKDKNYEFPLVEGSEDEKGIDIKTLRAQTGLITYDPGYKNTGSCKSAITFLNGEEGILRYRGYSIEELCDKASFIEVAFLLIFGDMPTTKELGLLNSEIRKDSLVDEDLKSILKSFPKSAHPMGILSSLLMAKFPILASWTHRKVKGLPLNYANTSLSYVENIAHMMFKLPHQDFEPSPVVVNALNKLLILHADHEQNCSTSTVRIVGSSHAGLFASVSAGISALWGPLHGGANQAVIEMLEAIKADGGDTKKYMAKAKDKNDPFRLMGFGHRVYKNFDPRARIIKKAADEVLEELGINDPVLEIAKGLEKEALNDPYFIERKLYPNVDFYSGIIYRALGIPTEMFTVMFALGRLPGWIAQWSEMRKNNEPIGRPRQIYTGSNQRNI